MATNSTTTRNKRPPALDKMPSNYQPRKGAGWQGPGDSVVGGVTGSDTPDAVSVERRDARTAFVVNDPALVEMLGDILNELRLLRRIISE